MNQPTPTLLAAALCAVLGSQADASHISHGRIAQVLDGTGNNVGSSVDHWYFTVNSDDVVTIDTLSWEVDSQDFLDGDGDFNETFDVNNDGEIAFIDPYIYLFNDDGDLTEDDLLSANDDSDDTFDDGSIFRFDSYLSQPLPAGDYVLAVGAFSLNLSEAVAQFNDETFYPTTADGLGGFSEIASAPYQVTWSGDLTVTSGPSVPEPTSAMLVVAGIVGCWGRRR